MCRGLHLCNVLKKPISDTLRSEMCIYWYKNLPLSQNDVWNSGIHNSVFDVFIIDFRAS